MPKQINIDKVAELSEKVQKAKAIYLTDYRGLTHKQLEDLHRTVKKSDGEYVVVKNSLLRLAINKLNIDTSKTYNGPTAALFSFGDEVTALKEMFKFIKTNALPIVKIGLFGGKIYPSDDVIRLSKLPSKTDLQAQVVSRISGPMYGLVYALNGNLQKLVYVLGQVKGKSA